MTERCRQSMMVEVSYCFSHSHSNAVLSTHFVIDCKGFSLESFRYHKDNCSKSNKKKKIEINYLYKDWRKLMREKVQKIFFFQACTCVHKHLQCFSTIRKGFLSLSFLHFSLFFYNTFFFFIKAHLMFSPFFHFPFLIHLILFFLYFCSLLIFVCVSFMAPNLFQNI